MANSRIGRQYNVTTGQEVRTSKHALHSLRGSPSSTVMNVCSKGAAKSPVFRAHPVFTV
jgi:hypothetical protein